MHIHSRPNNKYKIISTAEFKIYSPVQQFKLAQNWFSYSPLSLNLNLNLKFSLVQFRLCKLNHGSVRVQFRFELISKPNFCSTMRDMSYKMTLYRCPLLATNSTYECTTRCLI